MFGLTQYESRRNQIASRRPRDLFDYFFNDDFMPAFTGGFPAFKADIRETDKEYIIDAELPGVTKDDIKLDLNEDVLTICVEKSEETKEEKNSYIRRERRYGSSSRSFRIENIKHEGVNAKYDNGVLSVSLPKLREAPVDKRSIDIQ